VVFFLAVVFFLVAVDFFFVVFFFEPPVDFFLEVLEAFWGFGFSPRFAAATDCFRASRRSTT
jgi:hypothetical protein